MTPITLSAGAAQPLVAAIPVATASPPVVGPGAAFEPYLTLGVAMGVPDGDLPASDSPDEADRAAADAAGADAAAADVAGAEEGVPPAFGNEAPSVPVSGPGRPGADAALYPVERDVEATVSSASLPDGMAATKPPLEIREDDAGAKAPVRAAPEAASHVPLRHAAAIPQSGGGGDAPRVVGAPPAVPAGMARQEEDRRPDGAARQRDIADKPAQMPRAPWGGAADRGRTADPDTAPLQDVAEGAAPAAPSPRVEEVTGEAARDVAEHRTRHPLDLALAGPQAKRPQETAGAEHPAWPSQAPALPAGTGWVGAGRTDRPAPLFMDAGPEVRRDGLLVSGSSLAAWRQPAAVAGTHGAAPARKADRPEAWQRSEALFRVSAVAGRAPAGDADGPGAASPSFAAPVDATVPPLDVRTISASTAPPTPDTVVAGGAEPAGLDLAPVMRVDAGRTDTPDASPGIPDAAGAARQVARAVLEYRGGEARMILDPEELGTLRLTVSLQDGGALIQIVAERPETAELMRRHADLLLQDLAESGVSSPRLSFASGGEADGRGEPHRPRPRQGATSREAPEPPGPERAAAHGRGLDMRV